MRSPASPSPDHAGAVPIDTAVLAIDGPGGTGKSTVSRTVAQRLDLAYLDTGAMYRAVAFTSLRLGIDPADDETVTRLAASLEIEITDTTINVGGVDASIEIRGPEVTRAVSVVAANPGVRAEMRSRQREWARRHGGGVIEGRDIGTVVFPTARLKVFLTADPEVRALRRHAEVATLELQAVAADLARRDAQDSSRLDSPLVAAPDAVILNTTTMSVDEVVASVLALW